MSAIALLETIRRVVRDEVARVRTAELGIVQEQHPRAGDAAVDDYACTVRLRDTGLVLRRVPVATQRIGVASIPAVGELVLVQFIGGDMNAPVITGRLYNDEDRPPPNDDAQWIMHLPLGARDDDAVHLELHTGEAREIVLRLGGVLTVQLRDDDPVVEIDIDGGKARLLLARDGALTLESGGAVRLKGREVSVEGDAVTIEASGDLTLKGSAVHIN
jgi:phage baseplate assembly protein gpV